MSSTPSKRTFTLRTLFIVVALICIWLGYETNQARRQRAAVRWVVEAGGRVGYDYQRNMKNKSVASSDAAPGPGWLRNLIGDEYFQDVVEVDFANKRDFKPNDLKWLAEFPKLDTVNLNFSNIDDDGLAHLAHLARLKAVYLEKCDGVTDVGLSHLAKLRRLESLSLLATRCSDDGVRKHIPNLTKLAYLDIAGIPVTSETASELCHLQNLSMVHLGRVGYPAAHDLGDAVESIKEQLPNCQVNDWPPSKVDKNQ